MNLTSKNAWTSSPGRGARRAGVSSGARARARPPVGPGLRRGSRPRPRGPPRPGRPAPLGPPARAPAPGTPDDSWRAQARRVVPETRFPEGSALLTKRRECPKVVRLGPGGGQGLWGAGRRRRELRGLRPALRLPPPGARGPSARDRPSSAGAAGARWAPAV